MPHDPSTRPETAQNLATGEPAEAAAPVTLPTGRAAGCPFDPPARLAELREERPLARMTYPDGHIGWLATGYSTVRAIMGDSRFSSRYELMHYPLPGGPEGPLPPAPVGDMTGMDAPEHTRFRRILTGRFTVRRMRELSDRVAEITAAHLDAMERGGPGVDLVEAFARPLPALMICELLGVPYADRERFQGHAHTIMSMDVTPEDRYGAFVGLQEYMAELVAAKRAEPADDLLGDLARDSDLTDEELVGIGGFLLAAGLDTTANMIAHGTFALLSAPAQADALRADPDLAPQAVEELMRYLTVAHTSVKSALVDVELDGHIVRAGESVTLSLEAANRDPERFPDPDVLDLHRKATGHLGFGHGIHQCLGQQLARVELTVALPALLRRFPSLRLDVPADEVPLRTDMSIYGVHRLPVTWDEV
ncbi:Putative cytochrome P450 hydroxylase [Streptomyces venezuelae]|uniref:cytochrome P450 n=1 Tax=Streptomyces gardneri TaxID=66892 RepID=UPI0006BC843C|nr:cytochrome P450 [Streptomyces gardneri]ALO06603.1 Putative cytochrome P450 hydroxylase [Streptomyces venezuelae]QPK44019.1 cytochrome P450 [Streptomyces gardneri]WRK35291.1 cytochrome P450 [Streptomyces venezuelae]CUM43120.1 putative cytochrome P450 hydroxylase [Streptomyces venezuelae]